MGFFKNLAKNGIKSGVIKGLCFSAKSVYADTACEIVLESIANSVSERAGRNEKIKVQRETAKEGVKWNMCMREYPKGREDPIDVMIRNSARRPADRFRNQYPQSRIDIINKIEVDLKKRMEIIKFQAGIN